MPTTLEEHVVYTRDELTNMQYYCDLFSFLEKEQITTYLDIGANTGEYRNIITEKLSSTNKSFLIEPDLDNYKFMMDHVIDKNKCVFFNIAIGYGAKFGKIIKHANVGGYQIEKCLDPATVQIKTLEELKIPVVDLLKMDIEGMEFEVIENSTYLKKVKWLDIEFHQTPEQSNNYYIKNYIEEKLPEFDIVAYQKDPNNNYGRCLLKNKL